MKNILFVIFNFLILSVGYYLEGWWKFIPSTFFIILLNYFFYPIHWKKNLGFSNAKTWLLPAFVIFVIFTFLSNFLIKLGIKEDYYTLQNESILDYVVVIFQTLNEELIFRSLFLTCPVNSGFANWKIIIFPSVIFPGSHWLFYFFNMKLENQGLLSLSTLFTLFLFGVGINSIFLSTRSILIPWALHCGWNLNRFGMQIVAVNAEIGKNIPEYKTFNLLEGSVFILNLALVLSVISVIYYIHSQNKIKKIN